MALTDTFVKNCKLTGSLSAQKHADSGGMYLLVKKSGKYWRMDYAFAGKRKTLALGVYPIVSLQTARKKRDKAHEQLSEGLDPGVIKRAEKYALNLASQSTFEAVAREWLDKTKANRAEITQSKVRSWLERDVFPFVGKMPIGDLGPRDVLGALRHMEKRGALDSVQRVKQVCGQVFRYAVVIGCAQRDVTQDLKGAFEKRATEHRAAITEPDQFGALLRAIHDYSGHAYTQAALKLAPLVFLRPGELRHAEWSEIDFKNAQWRIPASKMKMKMDHIVPLSKQSIKILRAMHEMTGHGKYVFPGLRTGERPMSENTINSALRGMGYAKEVHSAHGFRASARTILDEVMNERVDLIEHQLAHLVKDANGRAYNRTAHLPARAKMMQRWADYLDRLRLQNNVKRLKAA